MIRRRNKLAQRQDKSPPPFHPNSSRNLQPARHLHDTMNTKQRLIRWNFALVHKVNSLTTSKNPAAHLKHGLLSIKKEIHKSQLRIFILIIYLATENPSLMLGPSIS